MGILNNLVQVFMQEAQVRLEKEIRELVHTPFPGKVRKTTKAGTRKRKRVYAVEPPAPTAPNMPNVIPISPGLDYMPPKRKKRSHG